MGSPGFPKLRGTDGQASQTQDNIAQQLTPIARALAKTPIMGSPPPGWLAPSLVVGFANTGGALAVAGYHLDALGYVHSKGSLTHAAGVAANSPIMTFPRGYRPRETLRLAVPVTPGAQWVTVAPTGVVSTAFAIAAGQEIDLAFSFLAEQ